MEERLTHQKWSDNIDLTQEYGYQHIYKRLYEYEDLEEQGLIVRLPCKVGDKFWYINIKHEIVENTVYKLGTCGGGIWEVCDSFSSWHLCEIVYFTRAEAEKKLKELKGEE